MKESFRQKGSNTLNNLRLRWLFLIGIVACLCSPGKSSAVGTLISAPNRFDMVHDQARDILYITSGSTVLRYHMGSDAFLSPFQLSGNLRGIDLSPDGNTLVVADGVRSETNVWIHVIDLLTETSSKVVFTRDWYEGGTYSVAFGADGAVLISSTFEGSGSVPLRRYDPLTGIVQEIASIEQSSMLAASADGTTIGIAENNSSGGPVDRFDVGLQSIVKTAGTEWFNYEISVSKDGSQFAVPTYGGTFIYDGDLHSITNIGVYASGQPIGGVYHPTADAVFFPWATTREIRAYSTITFEELARYDFEQDFTHTGNSAFTQGRLKISRDGAILFSTVAGGIRYLRHNLNVPQFYRMAIASSPPKTGQPVPLGYGTNWFPAGSIVTNTVGAMIETNQVRYRCDGWSGTGSVPANGTTNSLVFTLNSNSALVWNWTATHFQLRVSATGQGNVNVTNAWYASNATANLVATPSEGFRFVRWLGDVPGALATNASLTLTMDAKRSLIAVFASEQGSGSFLAGDWPTFGNGPQHTGYFQGVLGETDFVPRWVADVGGTLQQVAVAENKIFVVSANSAPFLAALQETSGQRLWTTFVPAGSVNPPTYDSGAIYMQRGNYEIWSFNAANGQTNWVSPHSAQWESYMAPVVANGGIWINGGYYGGIYGFNQANGAQKFFQALEQYDDWTPAYYNNTVYSWVEGKFRAHDPETGVTLWTLDLGWSWSGWSMNRTMAIANGQAFVVGNPNLYAIDLASHQSSWQVDGNFSGTPAVANGLIYAISNAVVTAYDCVSGQFVARFTADTALQTQPIVTDNALIIASSTKTYIFDLFDHTLRQTIPVGGALSLANGVLYVASSGKLYAYSVNDDVQLLVNGNIGEFGQPTSAGYGTNWFIAGTSVTTGVASAVETNGGRYDCTGWTGSGNVPASGTTNIVTFVLTNNSALTWNWVPAEFQLIASPAGPGFVSVSNAWYAANATATITATPSSGYRFAKWLGDVPTGLATNNPVTLTMDRARQTTAFFVSTNQLPETGEWPMFGKTPGHTGYSPGALGTATFGLRWTAVIGGNLQQVAVGGNRVFVTPYQYFGSAFLASIHEFTGKTLWWYTFNSCYSINPPAYDSGSVYVQRGNHAGDTHLWSFNAATGNTNWLAPHAAQWERYMSPTIADGGIWVDGGSYGGMYGFNQTNGSQKFFVGLRQYDNWTPAYYNQKLYTLVGGIFQESDPQTGASIWSLDVGSEYGRYGFTSTLVVQDGRAYFNAGTNVTSVDIFNRRIAWRVGGSFSGFPAVANGIVYVISGNKVNAYSNDGNFLGSYAANEALQWQPIVTDDALIVASASKTYVYDLVNFTLRQTIPVGGYLSFANKVLFIANSSGNLSAYSLGADTSLAIRTSSGQYGNPFPYIYGTNIVSVGSSITTTVQSPTDPNNGTRYIATGWAGTGSAPATGTNNIATFTITNASTLTWNWKTQYFLNTEIVSNGVVDISDAWFDANATVKITATPSNYFHFVEWSGDISGTSNVIDVTLSSARLVIAHFDADRATNNTALWWLAQNGISPNDAGALADTDSDGLANWQEFACGTNPNLPDTDGDSYVDGLEVTWNSSPTSSQSIPKAQVAIFGNPLPYGAASPLPYGTNLVALLQNLTNSVPPSVPGTNGMRYYAVGWSGTGDVPANGNTNRVSFFLSTNSTLTWNWQRQFYLSLGAVSNGTVTIRAEIRDTNGILIGSETSPDNWWNEGKLLTVEATPSNYFRLAEWGGDVSGSSNQVTLAMTSPRTVTVQFVPSLVTNDVPEWWLAENNLPISNQGALDDTDDDTLANWQEFFYGTDPNKSDSDDDTYSDSLEISRGSDPNNAARIPRVSLVVSAQPQPHGNSAPFSYGSFSVPLFTTVTNSISPIVDEGNGIRYVNSGWIGSGDVATSGNTNSVIFTLNTNSTLTWLWRPEFMLKEMISYGLPSQFSIRTEQKEIAAYDGRADELFGWRVAVDGDYALVGAPLNSTARIAGGAAYLFKRDGTNWAFQTKLTAYDNLPYNYFGCAVALQNDVAIIAGYGGSNSNRAACTGYIYRRNGNAWNFEGKLNTAFASETWMTCAVATDGTNTAIAATTESTRATEGGAVFIYRKNGSYWQLDLKLFPSDAKPYQHFGSALSLKENRVLIGAYGDTVGTASQGAAYIFRRLTQGNWSLESKLFPSKIAPFGEFGASVSLEADRALVGAPYDEVNGLTSGSAFVFHSVTNGKVVSWTKQSRLLSANPAWNEQFGSSVALQGNIALVGAPGANGASANSGMAMLFKQTGTNWQQANVLYSSSSSSGDDFGASVGLSEGRGIIGAPEHDVRGHDSGAVFTYDLLEPTLAGTTSWWSLDSIAQTSFAAETLTISNLVFQFVGWELNGIRQITSNNVPINPLTIQMNEANYAVAVYLPQNADADGDGLPDWWEQKYLGTNLYDANSDSDRDGAACWQEWMAGTNPADENSTFKATGIRSEAGDFLLQWPSTPGRTYRIKCSTNIESGFSIIATNLIATPPLNSFSDSTSQRIKAFYLIEIE